jgi:hypothetical protein
MPYNSSELDQSATLCRIEAVDNRLRAIEMDGTRDEGCEVIMCLEGQGPREHPERPSFRCALNKGDLLLLGLNYSKSSRLVAGKVTVSVVGGIPGSVAILDPATGISNATVSINDFFIPRFSKLAQSGSPSTSLGCGVNDKVLKVQTPAAGLHGAIEAHAQLTVETSTASRTRNPNPNPHSPRPIPLEIRVRQQLV